MSAYPDEGYSQGISSTVTLTDRQITARQERIKALDEALMVLDKHVVTLTDRLGPALRSAGPQATDPESKSYPLPAESDIVAHLRHTTDRVSGISEVLSDVLNRLDI